MIGYVVAFSFGKGAYEEVARVKKEGIEIKLITVKDILDKKIKLISQVNVNDDKKNNNNKQDRLF